VPHTYENTTHRDPSSRRAEAPAVACTAVVGWGRRVRVGGLPPSVAVRAVHFLPTPYAVAVFIAGGHAASQSVR
jgi:hypothetical protein